MVCRYNQQIQIRVSVEMPGHGPDVDCRERDL
jgi:hypothetical protein